MRAIFALGLVFVLVPTVEAQAQGGSRPPRIWAVVAGLEDYNDPALADNPGAVADSRLVRSALVRAGWTGDEILYLADGQAQRHGPADIDSPPLSPTAENLRWAVEEWLPTRASEGDCVLLYLGARAAPGPPGGPSQSPALTIRAIDSPANRPGWALDRSLDALASRVRVPIVVLLDLGIDDPDEAIEPGRFLAQLARWPGVSAWLAPGRPSEPEAGLGTFATGFDAGLGSAEKPANLAGTLHRLNVNPDLSARGFRSLGGLPPGLTLWRREFEAMVTPDPSLLLQQGHGDRVTGFAFAPDGLVISAAMDSTLRAWRLEDRAIVRSLDKHTIGVTAMALVPDGSKLATGDGAGRVWFWETPAFEGTTPRGPAPHSGAVARIDAFEGGHRFASLGALDGEVLLWDATTDPPTSRELLRGASAIAADGDRLAVVVPESDESPGSIRLFDPEGHPVAEFQGPGGLVRPGLLALKGPLLAAVGTSGELVALDLGSEPPTPRTTKLEGRPRSLTIAAGTGWIALDREILALKLPDGELRPALEAPGPVAEFIASEDGRRFAALSTRGDLRAWEVRPVGDEPPLVILDVPAKGESRATALGFGPRGETLVVGEVLGGIRSWELPSGRERPGIAPHRGRVEWLAASSDGRRLLQITRDWVARVWDLPDGRSLPALPGLWTSGAFLPDGRLALAAKTGGIAVVDPTTGEPAPIRFDPPPAEGGGGPLKLPFARLTASPDGRFLAGATDGVPLACVWRVEGGAPIWVDRSQGGPIEAIAFAGDSRHLLTASTDGSAYVWPIEESGAVGPQPRWRFFADDRANLSPGGPISASAIDPGRPWRVAIGQRGGRVLISETLPDGLLTLRVVGNLDGEARAFAFAPDGSRLVAGGADKTLRVWETPLGRPIGPATRLVPQHSEQVNALAFLPEGPTLVSASDDATVRFWGLGAGRAEPPLLGSLTSDRAGSWLAYTPDGQFDGSPGAEASVAWVADDRILPLEQFYDVRHRYGLAGLLRRDGPPPPHRPGSGPPRSPSTPRRPSRPIWRHL